jgi:hypothetical protein
MNKEELEKEAQRSFDELDDWGVGDDWSIEESYKNGYSNGAEFGYNKANEWHYVKDGDLPKEENLECLCIIRPMKEEGESFENKDFRGVLYFRNGKFYLDEDNSNDYLKETNSDFTDLVIAWKEIVLPKY